MVRHGPWVDVRVCKLWLRLYTRRVGVEYTHTKLLCNSAPLHRDKGMVQECLSNKKPV